tara:strand:- start:2925 stop:3086 length:162 start_codon:yes stop_codon:yes gene_type:complete
MVDLENIATDHIKTPVSSVERTSKELPAVGSYEGLLKVETKTYEGGTGIVYWM